MHCQPTVRIRQAWCRIHVLEPEHALIVIAASPAKMEVACGATKTKSVAVVSVGCKDQKPFPEPSMPITFR